MLLFLPFSNSFVCSTADSMPPLHRAKHSALCMGHRSLPIFRTTLFTFGCVLIGEPTKSYSICYFLTMLFIDFLDLFSFHSRLWISITATTTYQHTPQVTAYIWTQDVYIRCFRSIRWHVHTLWCLISFYLFIFYTLWCIYTTGYIVSHWMLLLIFSKYLRRLP